MLTMVNDGPNPGNWRYLLHISPVCAFFATVGFNNLSLKSFRNTQYAITSGFAVLVLLFLSKATDGFMLLDKPEYIKFGFVAVLFLLSVTVPASSKTSYMKILSGTVILLAAVHLYFVEPKKLSPENITIKETAEFVDTLPDKDKKEILANHTFLLFYSLHYKEKPDSYKRLNSKTLSEAPKGSYIIWDSHYGYRPEFTNDVQLETLQNETKYKLIKQFISGDRRFGAFVFEKL
jgi:hypothetical protein